MSQTFSPAQLTRLKHLEGLPLLPALGMLGLATVLPLGLLLLEAHLFWTPLQQHYLALYLRSSLARPGPVETPLLTVVHTKRQRLATDADVELLSGGGAQPFILSGHARQAGALRLAWLKSPGLTGPVLSEWLRLRIYGGRSAWTLLGRSFLPAQTAATLWAGWLFLGRRRRRRDLLQGRVLEGPRIVGRAEFNRRKRSDGIGFRTRERLTLPERLLGREPERRRVRIPKREENHHLLLMGDTGAGKSSLLRQLLLQIAERGETAIVYDPALEYTPQFYEPGRGDQILNPLDLRMPYWVPGEEITHRAEALTFAKSLFPDKQNDSRFFVESARKIFAHLLCQRPTAAQISQWMKRPEEMDRLLAGTELAPLIDVRAAGQRSGVLASLNLVADAFELLPDESEGQGKWSAAAWSARREGWLFLSSTHEVRERLLPLASLWLDSLLLRLLRQTGAEPRPVWLILDELASLQKLPQLATGLAEGRKANVRIVLGFQGRSQMEARYGTEAETMLSQPLTKVFLRTSEPRAAEWVSKAIGEVRLERLRESVTRQPGWFGMHRTRSGSHTLQLELKTEPLVLASVIGGLPDLSGYVKSQHLVTPAAFDYVGLESSRPAFLPRPDRAGAG